MIKKLKTIKSLAVFRDFSWDNCVRSSNGAVEVFKQINILYGRNYSGKTTLSRIVRALEIGNISPNYTTPQFSVLWHDDSETAIAGLQGHGKTIRVFNEDFVRENLSFLTDSSSAQGEVRPFAVIGLDNVKIEEQIRAIETELGSAAEGIETGLFAQLKVKLNDQTTATNNHRDLANALQKKMTDKATGRQNGIKYRSATFGDQNYTIAKLEAEVEAVLNKTYIPIDDAKRQELERSLGETPKATIPMLPPVPLLLQSLCDKTKEAIERNIVGSQKIQELVREYALNEWVKKGRELHKDKRTICAFCGGAISDDRWGILGKHFDEETGRLEQDIDRLISEIKTHQQAISIGFNISREIFYTKYQSELDGLISEYQVASKRYSKQLDALSQQLEKRNQTITENLAFAEVEDNSADIMTILSKYDILRKKSNEHTNTIESAKRESQNILRLHEVRSFVDTIGYTVETAGIKDLEKNRKDSETATQNIQVKITEKQKAIADLKRQLNDEEKGAVKVNEYLNHFFGHQFLTLKAITDESTGAKQIKFEIMRGEQRAFNLSEGECSLIAFCYFMAKLNDIGTREKKAIIWIDDPISSLDGNHIFFVYSLLRAEIVGKHRFEQLFISTHNLEFLKYLKRLTGKDEQERDYQKAWFIVERTNDSASIKMMPKYLKEYITEFNYLFHQIYKCAKATSTDDNNYNAFYNFGNNARKFLEIFLYYKYPDAHDDATSKFFGGNIPAFLAERVNNEQSHMVGTFERGSMPVDIPEIQTVATEICQTIRELDIEQYNALLRSIGENPETLKGF